MKQDMIRPFRRAGILLFARLCDRIAVLEETEKQTPACIRDLSEGRIPLFFPGGAADGNFSGRAASDRVETENNRGRN